MHAAGVIGEFGVVWCVVSGGMFVGAPFALALRRLTCVIRRQNPVIYPLYFWLVLEIGDVVSKSLVNSYVNSDADLLA